MIGGSFFVRVFCSLFFYYLLKGRVSRFWVFGEEIGYRVGKVMVFRFVLSYFGL